MSACEHIQPFFSKVDFDAELIRKLPQQGPRYTSYPTADRFGGEFRMGDYLEAVTRVRSMRSRNPLSLYIHIPFCQSLCYYCACNKIITKNRSKAETYLGYLKREVTMQARLFDGMHQLEQLHFGGGTPTYLTDEQMGELMEHLHKSFRFVSDSEGEFSIEIDPRTVTPERIKSLRAQGFNRLSLGVQDFNEDVQKAVNRIQPKAQTLDAMAAAREAGFRSISIDLIYGLPKQTPATMAETLDSVIKADPDRISVYSYAHLPHLFKAQRRIADEDMPDSETKLQLLSLCIERLTGAGYIYIGMDHFAKPNDELAVAQAQGRLHRNFQGYSTHADAEMVSCGVSAISAVGGTYSQNVKTLDDYYDRLDNNELPIERGIKLNVDDMLRRFIIQMLMCNFELSLRSIELGYSITFREYFAKEIEKLREYEKEGLLTLDEDWLTVTPKGRLLIRNISMVFDRYIGKPNPSAGIHPVRFSRTI